MAILRSRATIFGLLAGALLAGGMIVALLLTSTAYERPAQAAGEPSNPLPPEIPRRDLPNVLDGTATDGVRIGDWIVVSGTFTEIELDDGSVIDQTGVYAYDIDTGLFHADFRPTFTRNSGPVEILDLEPAVDGSVYVGGKFATVNGESITRLAKLSLVDGSVDLSFDAGLDGPVRTMALDGEDLYLGGEFSTVGGSAHNRLARVDAVTGAADADFVFNITGSTKPVGEPYGPKKLHLTDDGTLVVVHRSRFVNTEARKGIALIDTNDDTLHDWATAFWGENAIFTIDAAVSPDDSYLVLVGNGGDFPFMGRDAAVAFPMTDLDDGDVEPMWITRNFDSTYAVGISDTAVFIGGHFCWTESDVAPDPWPGDGEFTNQNSCFGTFPAGRFAPGVVYRDQIAALDPVTGHALIWDPGSDALEGIRSIEVIDRGLLVGHDGRFFGRDGANSRSWNVGRHAFLDVDAPNVYRNTVPFIDQPLSGTCNGLEPTRVGTTRNDTIQGTAGDDVILAGPGDDRVYGAGGDDVICGGDGLDWLYGELGNDVLFGGDGRDRLWGDRGADELHGGDGRDVITGDAGNDRIYGGTKGDRLNGRNGVDVIEGNAGADQIQGGPKADTVKGGAGSDRCAGSDFGQPEDPGDDVRTCERD